MRTCLLILLLSFLITPKANAWLEFRGIGGAAIIDPLDLNGILKTNNVKEVYTIPWIGGDIVAKFPDVPLGCGVRYQYGGIKTDSANGGLNESEIQVSRTSLVAMVGERPDSKKAGSYYGYLVGTYGVAHTQSVKVKTTTGDLDFKDGTPSSITLGLESGTVGKHVIVGGEIFWQRYVITGMKTTGSEAINLNLTGFGLIVHMGISLGI